MRVYNSGKYIPMADVTRDTMCSSKTVVMWDQDKDVDFPDSVKQASLEAPGKIIKVLRLEKKFKKICNPK